jgi:pyridoxal phosphate-dependent aminotransferase EpsN
MKFVNKRIYLSPPHIGEEERKFVAEAFDTNWVAPCGPNVDAFEKEFGQYLGANEAVALSSGTAAIHLALRLLGVNSGDTVFCSSLTFIASASPILYMKAKAVFIDSEPETWNMSPKALKQALLDAERSGQTPKAVIVVNLYGQNAEMDAINRICNQYGIPVIEDAAESLGATYKGQASGTLGKFGIFSFNGNKIITTSGGGMLVSDDREALEKARFLASQAKDLALHYQHSELGYNYRMSNVLAGIGRGQLKVLDERVKSRRLVFENYWKALHQFDGLDFMPEASFGHSTRWLTAMLVDPDKFGTTATKIINLLSSLNIEARPIWKPLHLQPIFKNCRYYPNMPDESFSEYLFNRGICLPSGSSLTQEDQQRIIDSILSLVKK